ncbi:MAG: (2Fe-2S)-binding protein [Flavipsychrobacter sp.]|nr:(2Fe-2S)-binding protein [Flavipsychrobacter sp.]
MDLYNWHKIDTTALIEHKLTEMLVAGKRIGVLRRNDAVYAFTAACPHQGAPLCDGWLDGQGRIVCPMHKFRFDPQTGRNTTGEGYKLFTYPIEIRDNEVYVGFLP